MKYFWLLVTVLFTLLIFYNSSMDISVSGSMSSYVTGFLLWLEQHVHLGFDAGADILEHNVRKLAHFIEFAALCWFLCTTFTSFHVSNRTASGYILFIGLLVAVIDEYIQLSAAGRSGRVMDVLLDFSGVLCMWLAYRMCQKL